MKPVIAVSLMGLVMACNKSTMTESAGPQSSKEVFDGAPTGGDTGEGSSVDVDGSAEAPSDPDTGDDVDSGADGSGGRGYKWRAR